MVICLCASAYAASSTTGWYYAGETFKIGDVIYSVEGTDYEKVLLGVGGQLFVIRLGDCVQTPTSKYCYEDSAYPSDSKHIKYSAGKELFGYYLSINSVAP